MTLFELIGQSLPASGDAAIPIAASRAGGIGLLDLCYTVDLAEARRSIEHLARWGRGTLGVRLDPACELWSPLIEGLPTAITTVVIAVGDTRLLPQAVAEAHTHGRTVWVEVTSVDAAHAAVEAGADGLIAVGQEAGGMIGEETAFVLLQRLIATINLPLWVRGGIGLHSAAACYAAGAAGVVLDAQLALAKESLLPDDVRAAIAAMDGSETTVLGGDLGVPVRMHHRRASATLNELERLARDLHGQPDAAHQWCDAVGSRVGWGSNDLWLLGQDAAFAAALAQGRQTVGGIFAAMEAAVEQHVAAAAAHEPFSADTAMARAHGTRYPIVQGPMTRVSDTAPFALSVADAGGLPFLALALMRGADVETLLETTSQLLGDRPWGVGVLGFVPAHLREEQIAVIRRYRPPFALIAGGRPDQAKALAADGITAYLHVPSPGLLRLFMADGARHFVFEGRECGGHVGPRSSFVLWNTMIDVLLQVPAAEAASYHILFAGGIHDDLSAAMVATMAAPLVERGMRIGVLMGTAYLFTHEAVASGAIMPGFQAEALECTQTATLETGPGHATRCAITPFVDLFGREKQQQQANGVAGDELRMALEDLNLGRLRIASKGVRREAADDAPARYVAIDDAEQRADGMYMIGQVAALRHDVGTIDALHEQVSRGSTERLRTLMIAATPSDAPAEQPSNVAVVGMSCFLPQANDLQTYWEHILDKVDAVGEVPRDRWDWQRHFDADRTARDKIYSRWGGFLEDVAFDPTSYGIPPNTLRSIEPVQLLVLEAVRMALADAGYADRPFARERSSVILGAGGGAGALGEQYAIRASLPDLLETVPDEILNQLPEWTEDSFPGILLNVIAGRVANRFDLGGVNYTVDAACASSLAAVYQAVNELENGTSDVVITGGVDNVQNPFGFMCFSKTQALSPRGHCSTFDDDADGIAISEGVTIIVLKRLADAERDGDRIYAVIKGVAGSSDGRDRSLTAPRPAGQARALERAYRKAGFSPATVSLIEAHGTGTAVGDQAEAETLKLVFAAAGAPRQRTALGSVKSMIGHTKCAAGVAGLMKVALALHHKVLPATLHVTRPNTRVGFEDSPFYVNTETRPWMDGLADHPRRAGVSAFGFGGTNFHAVLEEYTDAFTATTPVARRWHSELLVWRAATRADLARSLAALDAQFERGARPTLAALAAALAGAARRGSGDTRLAIVAASVDDLRAKLATARGALDGRGAWGDNGIFFDEAPANGKVAFVFSGQGSQYPNMLRDLATTMPAVRETFERFDTVLADRFDGEPLSQLIYPIPTFDAADERAQQARLTATNVAQPALGAAEMALRGLLDTLGIRADMVGGHSYGEYAALCAAGVMDEATLARLSEARGRAIIESATNDLGTMAAVKASPDALAPLLDGIADVWIANLNADDQTIISGTRSGIAAAAERLEAARIGVRPIAVACAFHTPLMAGAQQRLAGELAQAQFVAPRMAVYSNTTATPYSAEPADIAALLARHLVEPVRWSEQIEAMYADGARVFLEVGPRNILAGLVAKVLRERPHTAVALDNSGRDGITQLHHALALLFVRGVGMNLAPLYAGRVERPALDLERLAQTTAVKPLAPTTWMVNGGQARPMAQPKRPPHHPVAMVVRGAEPSAPIIATNGHAAPSTAPTTNGHAAPLAIPSMNGHSAPLAVSSTNGHSAPSPQPASVVGSVVSAAPSAAVMQQFQTLMGQFVQTQRDVMVGYLGRGVAPQPAPLAPTVSAPTAAPAAIAPPTVPALPAVAPPTVPASPAVAPAPPVVPTSVAPARATVAPEADIDEALLPAIGRYVLQPTPEPLPSGALRLMAGGVVVVTDDGVIAPLLVRRLADAGHRAVLVRHGDTPASANGVYTIDMMVRAQIDAALDQIRREHGAVAGIVHCLPARAHAPLAAYDLARWQDDIALETISLVGLAQSALPDLERAAANGSALFVGVTALGGTFGTGPDATAGFPGSGTIAGVCKTAAIEWPDVRVQAIDLDPGLAPAVQLDLLVAELFADARTPEVGYPRGVRTVLTPVEAALPPSDVPALDASCVVLVTGGGRGITADVALHLARRYRPTLVLMGRSPLPPTLEAADTAALLAPEAIKHALIARQRATGVAASPAEIERAYRALVNERDIRTTLESIAATGARVVYRSVDVCDEVAFTSAIAAVYDQFGRIDGVIHGAGVIEDKLLRDKSLASFGRVLRTKADSAFILSRALRPEALRFVVFFTSVSGRFGNRGQADYSAANEVLCKLAATLDRSWAARVVAVDWGPWDKRGMVSPELKQQFARRGVSLVPVDTGCAMLDQELRVPSGASEIVIAGIRRDDPSVTPDSYPLLRGLAPSATASGVEVRRTIDPAHDRYLLDHTLDSKPVFPFAMALETMVEVVQQAWPDLVVTAVRDMQVLRGITVEQPRHVRIIAKVQQDPPADRIGSDVAVEIVDDARPEQRFYRATVELSDRATPSPVATVPQPKEPFPLTRTEAYERWLFHGPMFAGIQSIDGFAPDAISATLTPSRPTDLLHNGSGAWMIDPVVFDSGLQLIILWTRATLDMTPLPARFRRYHRFDTPQTGAIRCVVQVTTPPQAHVFEVDISFVDEAGRVCGLLEGMECPSSAALNRLAGRPAAPLASVEHSV